MLEKSWTLAWVLSARNTVQKKGRKLCLGYDGLAHNTKIKLGGVRTSYSVNLQLRMLELFSQQTQETWGLGLTTDETETCTSLYIDIPVLYLHTADH